jgi:hypothetical protein
VFDQFDFDCPRKLNRFNKKKKTFSFGKMV